MKKILVFAFIILKSFNSFAQTDSSIIEQYCQLIATPRLLSNKVTIDIDFGEQKKFWVDTRIKDYDGTLKKFNTIIDALNFMGKNGWIFINAYPVESDNTVIYHYAFKKQFLRKDIAQY